MKKKRVLWLLNHTTLMNAEVPLLINLGFEVFTPKIFPPDDANRSASVTYDFDETLTIPIELLKQLNGFDFYSSRWPASLRKRINAHFEIVICAFFPKMLNKVSDAFDGDIFLRVFGMAGDTTYASLIEQFGSKGLIRRFKTKDRIWFAPSYANIAENEPHWLKKNTVYLPLGLPLDYYKNTNQWQPVENSILFICPRIKTSPYYQQVYKEFKSSFDNFPHIIAGAQPEAVEDDSHVTGFISVERYQQLMKTCKVMFYHSREERHLHYHPLEAVVCGMPLIFMAGGMLDYLAGEQLPGSCETFSEARRKIARVFSGDEEFINSIIESQKILLRDFGSEYVRSVWEASFLSLSKQLETISEDPKSSDDVQSKPYNIGIWMHVTTPKGFANEGITRLLAQIVRAAQTRTDVSIHIACVPWVKEPIVNFMEDLGVDGINLNFLLLNDIPPLLFRIYTWWEARQSRVIKRRALSFYSFIGKIKKLIKSIANLSLKKFVSARGWIVIPLSILVAIGISPLLFIYGIVQLVFISFRKLLIILKIKQFWDLLQIRRQASFSSIVDIFQFPRWLYNLMVEAEIESLASRVSKEKEIDAWYFPYPRMSEIEKFKKPIIVAVPDIVYLDFPTIFSREDSELIHAHSGIEKTVRKADAVITYSNYVKDKHVVEPGYQPEEKVHVIRHAPMETREFITSQPQSTSSSIKFRSRLIIRSYIKRLASRITSSNSLYLQSLPFGEFDYLFVSSQTRPHKNHLNLLKAYEILLREKFINIKLIFTGSFSLEMQNYIVQKKLHLDVLSLSDLPPKVHTAFYACAKLAIAPTLFEGGFPFIFSEALSVGTPVMMSDIPVVRETLPEVFRKEICFDPYDINDMISQIAWGIKNPDLLLKTEVIAYNQLKNRTWEQVADEYILAIMSTMKRNVS